MTKALNWLKETYGSYGAKLAHSLAGMSGHD